MTEPALPSPLSPAALHILVVLSGGEQHGYAIMQAVGALSDGTLRLGPATLYRTIRQLLEAGLIAEVDERPDPARDDERRRYYRLSDQGVVAAQAELARLERLVNRARERGLLPGELLGGLQ